MKAKVQIKSNKKVGIKVDGKWYNFPKSQYYTTKIDDRMALDLMIGFEMLKPGDEIEFDAKGKDIIDMDVIVSPPEPIFVKEPKQPTPSEVLVRNRTSQELIALDLLKEASLIVHNIPQCMELDLDGHTKAVVLTWGKLIEAFPNAVKKLSEKI
jgi:hypothetical protein